MKHILKKVPGPSSLDSYLEANPKGKWEEFKRHKKKPYRRLWKRVFREQDWLCAYCERKINKRIPESKGIEHFIDKSFSIDEHNYALDWNNLIGVCCGGRNNNASLLKDLSCDASKAQHKKDIKLTWSGYILNPLEININLCLFDINRRTGELTPNTVICNEVEFKNNKYSTTQELVDKTIYYLNLNCSRLKDERLSIIEAFDERVKKARKENNIEIHNQISKQWFKNETPSFYTTKRILLGSHAEKYIR